MTHSPEMQATMGMTAETVGRDLLQAFVTEVRLMPKTWAEMSEAKQNDVLDRLRHRVETNVKMAVHLIASNGRTVVVGDLEQVTIKDGAKAVVKIGRGAPALHDLCEAQGQQVLVVVSGVLDHTQGMDQVQGESDQRAMDLGKEYTDADGEGMDGAGDPPDDVIEVLALPAPEEDEERDELFSQAAHAVVLKQRCGVSFLQRELGIGYNRAAAILEQLERAGIVSAPDANGARTIFMRPPADAA